MKEGENKYLEITTAKSVYHLPLEVVAKDRATYYEGREPGCYQEEFEITMKDFSEAMDWFQNNMNVTDFKEQLVKIKDVEIEEDFVNADVEIITK